MADPQPPPVREDLAGHDDAELVALAAAGRHDAFAAIMRRYNQRLFRIARAILKDDADAEDALQDAYLKAYRHLGGFEGRSSLPTWLSRVVVNEALRRLRARRTSVVIDSVEGRAHVPDNVVYLADREGTGPEDRVGNRELRLMLEAAIDELADGFRVVFLMREVEGMSVAEIAAALDIPEATVKTRAFRARRALRRLLTDRLDPVIGEAFTFLGARCDRIVARVLDRLPEIDAMR